MTKIAARYRSQNSISLIELPDSSDSRKSSRIVTTRVSVRKKSLSKLTPLISEKSSRKQPLLLITEYLLEVQLRRGNLYFLNKLEFSFRGPRVRPCY